MFVVVCCFGVWFVLLVFFVICSLVDVGRRSLFDVCCLFVCSARFVLFLLCVSCPLLVSGSLLVVRCWLLVVGCELFLF